MTAPARDAGLSERGKARLAEIKARNALVVALNNESWGSKLTQLQQRAFAEYMRRFQLDVSEIDNLGGRPYRNGRYYMRRIAELAREGRVGWVKPEHIGPDPRLDELAAAGDEWAITENVRRMRERIRLAVPPEATHAYLVTVKMHSLELPLEGAKWYVPGRTREGWSKSERGKKVQVSADPIGDENPITSIETRAWRRVGRLVAAEIPELRAQEEAMNVAEGVTAEAVAVEADLAEERNERATIDPQPLDGAGEDPYALGSGPMETVPVPERGEEVPVGGPQESPDFQDDRDIAD